MKPSHIQKLNKEISALIGQSVVNEEQALYKNAVSTRKKLTYAEFLSDKMLIVLVIRKGIPYSFFTLIRNYTPFDEKDWANFLDISTKTLERYRQSSKSFRSTQSEKIIEMSEVTYMGLDVFGTMDKLKLWLNTPNFSLGNLQPVELLKDSYGKEMVVGELTRINHGILA